MDALNKPALDIRHIVVAGPDHHPSAANGVHNVARQLVREQRHLGHAARLLVLSHADASWGTPSSDGEAIPLGGLWLRGRAIWPGRAAAEAVLDGAGPSTRFHIHGGREPVLAQLAARMRRHGLPYAVTVHGRFSHIYDRHGACLKRSTALYLRLAESQMLTGATFVQALSDFEARILRRISPRGVVAVVGNGAYSSRLGPPLAASAAPERQAGGPRFVFCGRYAIHHKGLDLLLRGFAQYRRDGGNGQLLLIGSGPARLELQALAAELGLGDNATIAGPLFGVDRDAAVAAGDYFVMPSRYEGVPLAALEAAAAGLPLLVTEETGLTGAVRRYGAGSVIEALSPEAVRTAFHAAEHLPPEQRAAQRQAAFLLARMVGDWSDIAAQLCSLYGSTTARAMTHRVA